MLGWVHCFCWMALGVFRWQCHSPGGRPGSQAAPRLLSNAAGWRCAEGSVQGRGGQPGRDTSPRLASPTSHEAQCPCVARGRA